MGSCSLAGRRAVCVRFFWTPGLVCFALQRRNVPVKPPDEAKVSPRDEVGRASSLGPRWDAGL